MNTRKKLGLLFLNNSAHNGILSRFSGSMLSQISRILQLLQENKEFFSYSIVFVRKNSLAHLFEEMHSLNGTIMYCISSRES